jgi:hypothetical protein
MRIKSPIDFKKIDWKAVDREKAKFFYNEALAFNNRLIDDINSLNSKALTITGFLLPVMSAAAGLLLASWGGEGRDALTAAMISACCGFFAALVFLLLAIFPRGVYRGEGDPESYFSGNYYRADMFTLFTCGIATLHRAIEHNYRVLRYRGKMFLTGILAFAATPCCAVLVFLLNRN